MELTGVERDGWGGLPCEGVRANIPLGEVIGGPSMGIEEDGIVLNVGQEERVGDGRGGSVESVGEEECFRGRDGLQ
jgi:hypothetical protein